MLIGILKGKVKTNELPLLRLLMHPIQDMRQSTSLDIRYVIYHQYRQNYIILQHPELFVESIGFVVSKYISCVMYLTSE